MSDEADTLSCALCADALSTVQTTLMSRRELVAIALLVFSGSTLRLKRGYGVQVYGESGYGVDLRLQGHPYVTNSRE